MAMGCCATDSTEEVSPLLPGRTWTRHYYVETFFFLFFMGAKLYQIVAVNAMEVFYCRYFWDVSGQVCLNAAFPFLANAQKFAVTANLIIHTLSKLVSLVLIFFIGSWSDIHGRKPLLLMPTIGLLVTTSLWTLATILPKINPLFCILFIMPFILTGGVAVLMFAAQCCISDITPETDRSVRLGFLQTFVYIACAFGSGLSVLLIPDGHTAVFSTSTVFLLLAALTVSILVKETIPTHLSQRSPNAIEDVFQMKHLRELTQFYQKQTPKIRRTIILVLTGRLLYFFAYTGNTAIEFLFLQLKMKLSLHDYGLYSTFSMIIQAMGLTGGTCILSHKLKIIDLFALMMISFLHIISTSFYMFSNDMRLIYIGCSIGLMNNLFLPFYKSLLSKLVDSNDVSKVHAAADIGESLFALVALLVYSIVYQLTLSTFPEAVCVLSSLAYAAILVILTIVAKMDGVSMRMKESLIA